MAKFAIFSDLHLTNKNSKFRFSKDGVSDLLTAQAKFVDWMCESVEDDPEIEGILFLGDWSDYSTLDPITATYSNRMVSRMLNTGVPILLLEGNHSTADQQNRFTVLGSIRELIGGSDAHLVTQIARHDIAGVSFFCLPYFSDYDKMEAEIIRLNEQASDTDPSVLLFHFPCINAMLDNGYKAVAGVEVKPEMIDNFDAVLGGDYHKPQQLVGTSKAYYVGAPFDLKYNESSGGKRGYVVLDIDETGYLLDWVSNPYNYDMISVSADELDVSKIENPEQMILKVTGDLDQNTKEELLSKGLYRFAHLSGRSKRSKPEGLDDVVVISDEEDYEMVKEQLDEYDLSTEVKEKVVEVFETLEDKGD